MFDYADYIPAISILTNHIILLQCHLILPFLSPEQIAKSHYFTHIKNKNIMRIRVAMVPVFGNLAIALYDFSNRKRYDKKYILEDIKTQGMHAFTRAASQLRKDPDIIKAVIEKDPEAAADLITEDQKNDFNFMLPLVEANGNALSIASDELRSNKDLARAAIKQNSFAASYVHDSIRHEIIREDGPLEISSEQYDEWFPESEPETDDSSITVAASSSPPTNVIDSYDDDSYSLKSVELMLDKVSHNGLLLKDASLAMRDDEDIVRAALMQNKGAFRYASPRLQSKISIINLLR